MARQNAIHRPETKGAATHSARQGASKRRRSERSAHSPTTDALAIVRQPAAALTSIPLHKAALACVLLGIGIWAYFPTLGELVAAWSREADYAHGYLVVPIAVLFLWLRRS